MPQRTLDFGISISHEPKILSLSSIPESTPQPILAPPSARSLSAQWIPCIAMLLLSFISLVDRSILGILSPVILRDLHLSAGQYGTAILVFSICYMLANPVWGISCGFRRQAGKPAISSGAGSPTVVARTPWPPEIAPAPRWACSPYSPPAALRYVSFPTPRNFRTPCRSPWPSSSW
jgi:hypothetical protein